MNEVRNLLIGFEIGPKTSQIAYFDRKAKEPAAVPARLGTNICEFPTVLSKKKDQDKWFAGFEAEFVAASSGIVRVRNPLEAALDGGALEIDGQMLEAAEVLAIFIREALKVLRVPNIIRNIDMFCVTTEHLTEQAAKVIQRALTVLGLRNEQCLVQNHTESFCFFGYCQVPEASARNLALIHFDGNEVKFTELSETRTVKPFSITSAEKPVVVLPDEQIRKDEVLDEAVNGWIDKTSYSGVFITGDGFRAEHFRKSIRSMSKGGARVFLGENLFAKGACWAAYEKQEPKYFKNRFYLGPNLVHSSVGIDLIEGKSQKWYPLIRAGINWYENKGEWQIILCGHHEVMLTVMSIDGKAHKNEKIELEGLPERPDRATRLLLRAECPDAGHCRIDVYDMGFGEMFPSSKKHWSADFEI